MGVMAMMQICHNVWTGVGYACQMRRGASVTAVQKPLYLGIDFGTSGARATLINNAATPVHELKVQYDKQSDEEWDVAWRRALDAVFRNVPEDCKDQIVSLAFDGTSSTTLLVDEMGGASLESPKWYNASQNQAATDYAKEIAPEGHTGRASTSTLCKVIDWHLNGAWQRHKQQGRCPRVLHQADWLSYLMHGLSAGKLLNCEALSQGNARQSDYTNALKLGYDPEKEEYPEWLKNQAFFDLLPCEIYAPGTPVETVSDSARQRYDLPEGCLVCAGTTDSIAAFLAAGASEVGEAVTSLGSTLAIKMLSSHRVDAVAFGVYSHRLGDKWLVGGASNTGGAVLKQFFTDEQLQKLTEEIDPETPTQLDYYPLVSPGERFPIDDPTFEPRLHPRPAKDAIFLQGILEGIARIEGQCYALLEKLGAGKVSKVWTAGGGAVNDKWTQIRCSQLGIPVLPASNSEASYGAALLAKQGFEKSVG